MQAIITPQGMYGFQYEIGRIDTDIDFIDSESHANGGRVIIVANGNRRGVLYGYDYTDPITNGDVYFEHTGFSITPTGTIEFLFKYGNLSGDITFTFYDGATRLLRLLVDESNSKIYYDNGGGWTEICGFGHSVWKIFKLDFDVDAGINGQFDFYFKNSDYTGGGAGYNVTNIEFENNATTIDELHYYAPHDAGGHIAQFYMDCIGITAEGYTIGDIQYAYNDVSAYMFNNRIHDAILPGKKKLTFSCHYNYRTYFNEGDYIDVFDDSNNLLFAGWIKTKSQDANGIYQFYCPGMANEIHNRSYDKSYSGDDTDTKQKDLIDNALEFCYRSTSIVGTTTTYDYEYNRACVYLFNLARFLERQVAYIEPDGKIITVAYNGITASGESWTLGDGNQTAYLVDIKSLKESIPGYYFGNTGITSVSVRYINNTQVTRPATPTETFVKKRLKEFRDSKIQELATAQQIGDNLYNIFSKDTIFLGMGGEGLGWLQPGETVEIENTRQITIAQAHFLLLSVIYDPKNDVHHEMIFSDNIITPREFKSDYDTSRQQIHTAMLQSCENQEAITQRCLMATGTYTGDATDNREITGLGFDPKVVQITIHWAAAEYFTWYKNDNMATWKSDQLWDINNMDNTIKLITDGFEINNNQASDYPNNNGKVFSWVAWG